MDKICLEVYVSGWLHGFKTFNDIEHAKQAAIKWVVESPGNTAYVAVVNEGGTWYGVDYSENEQPTDHDPIERCPCGGFCGIGEPCGT